MNIQNEEKTKIEVADYWIELLQRIKKNSARIMLLGDVDSGKSMFLKFLIDNLSSEFSMGIIDADIGQSTFGPPSCLSFTQIANHEKNDLHVQRLSFAGSFTPEGKFIPVILGLHRLLQYARNLDWDYLVMDTTGYVKGANAVQLKLAKIDLFQPNLIVAFTNNNELQPILNKVQESSTIEIQKLPVSNSVCSRSLEQRHRYRRSLLNQHFQKTYTHRVDFRKMICRNSWLHTGESCSDEEKQELSERLNCRVIYGEYLWDGLCLITDGCNHLDLETEQMLNNTVLHITEQNQFLHRLIAFTDKNGFCLDLGIITQFSFEEHELTIQSPLKNLDEVAWIDFGGIEFDAMSEEYNTWP